MDVTGDQRGAPPPSCTTIAGDQAGSPKPPLPHPAPLDGTDRVEGADADERSPSSRRHLQDEHATPDTGTQPSARRTSPSPSSKPPPQPRHGALDSTKLPVRPPSRTNCPTRKGEKGPRRCRCQLGSARRRKPQWRGGRGGKELAAAERGFALPLAAAGRASQAGSTVMNAVFEKGR